jgi:hypothetical protein
LQGKQKKAKRNVFEYTLSCFLLFDEAIVNFSRFAIKKAPLLGPFIYSPYGLPKKEICWKLKDFVFHADQRSALFYFMADLPIVLAELWLIISSRATDHPLMCLKVPEGTTSGTG